MQSNQERRSAARSRVFFGGEIFIDADLPSVECHVKNISGNGAGIVVQTSDVLPNQFDLVIRKTNDRHRVVVTWSRGRHLGLAYRPYSAINTKWSSPTALRQMLGLADGSV